MDSAMGQFIKVLSQITCRNKFKLFAFTIHDVLGTDGKITCACLFEGL